MKRMFLEKFFSASRTATIRKGNRIEEKLCMNIGRNSINFVPPVHTTRSASSVDPVLLMLPAEEL
ncbi:hypothetical protein CR513_17770, partial [Mucuna pruriens]